MEEDDRTEPTERLETEDDQGTGEARSGRPRRLLRSNDDRMIAGVAGGLGDYFGIDPIIVRIAFGISVFFGGLGLVAYLALYLFVPAADGTDSPKALAQRSRTTAALAIAFLALIAIPAIGGGLFWSDGPGWIVWLAVPVAAAIAGWAALRDRGWTAGRSVIWAIVAGTIAAIAFLTLFSAAVLLTAVGEGVAVALGLVAAGMILVALALAGVGRWLILPVVAIGLGVSAAAASDLDLGGGIGERVYVPETVAEIPADGYELGIGRLAIDLRELAWQGRKVDLDAGLGIGELVIAVPSRVCVVADAEVRAGELRVAGDGAEGVEAKLPPPAPSQARPQLRLNADLDLGELRVVNDDGVDLEDGRGRDDGPDEALRDRNAEACDR